MQSGVQRYANSFFWNTEVGREGILRYRYEQTWGLGYVGEQRRGFVVQMLVQRRSEQRAGCLGY